MKRFRMDATVFTPGSSTHPLSIAERVTGPFGMSARILLVDDNHIQSATRRAILEGCGREVFIALQGQQAMELLNDAETAKSIGLIITDHMMPVMSGPELVRELRRRAVMVPVVVLSGLPEAEAAYEDLDVVFRLKPFDPESLIQLVREMLGECMRRSA
jgi:CheY-like chemotaxis protein